MKLSLRMIELIIANLKEQKKERKQKHKHTPDTQQNIIL